MKFQNILAKVTYPGFSVNKTDSPFRATVKGLSQGLAQVKVKLRSVLTDDDEEEEIVPHIKGTFDFEVYDPIKIKAAFSHGIMVSWDDTTKEERFVKVQVNILSTKCMFTTKRNVFV